MPKYLNNKKGANLILVIVFLMLFMVVVTGISMVVSFGVNSGVVQRNYTQAYYAAKSINTSINNAIITDKITSSGISLLKQWQTAFNQRIETYTTPEGFILLPGGEISYSDKLEIKNEYIQNTEIKINNIITINYNAKQNEDSTITIKGTINVETSAQHDGHNYTIKSELVNTPTTGGGGSGGSTGDWKYVLGSANNLLVNASTFNGGVISNESIKMQEAKITGGLYSTKDIDVTYGSNIEGGIYSNTTISINGSLSTGDILASEKITFGGSSSTATGDVISKKEVEMQSGSTVGGNIISNGPIALKGWTTKVTKNIFSFYNSIKLDGATEVGGNVIAGNDIINKASGTIINGDVISKRNIDLTSGKYYGDVIAVGNIDLTGANIKGNVISMGYINLTNGKVSGNIIANGFINLTGSEVVGNIQSNSNVNLTNTSVIGNIYSYDGATTINGKSIDGNIMSKGDVKFPNGGKVKNIVTKGSVETYYTEVSGDIRAMGFVKMPNGGSVNNIYTNSYADLTNVTVNRNIQAVGYVIMPNNGSVTNISSNEYIDLTGVKVNGNIQANGYIKTGWSVTGNGTAKSNSYITIIDNNTKFSVEEKILQSFPPLNIEINVDSKIDVQNKINDKLTIFSDPYFQQKINSIVTVQQLQSNNFSFINNYQPIVKTEQDLKNSLDKKVFDTSQGDLYFETAGDLEIGNINIIGDNRVFIKLTGNSKILTFDTAVENQKLAKQLFFISDNVNYITLPHSNKNKRYINAQIYMPKSKFDPNWNNITFYGSMIISGMKENNNWYENLTMNLIHGNYTNTNIQTYYKPGGSSSIKLEPVEINGDWSIRKYYN